MAYGLIFDRDVIDVINSSDWSDLYGIK